MSAPPTTWFVRITWSYYNELFTPEDVVRFRDSLRASPQFNYETDEVSVVIVTEAEHREVAELSAFANVQFWLLDHDLPGITTWDMETLSLAEVQLDLAAARIILDAHEEIFGSWIRYY